MGYMGPSEDVGIINQKGLSRKVRLEIGSTSMF